MRHVTALALCFLLAGCASIPEAGSQPKNDFWTVSKKVLKTDYMIIVLPREDVVSGNLGQLISQIAGYFAHGEKHVTKYSVVSSMPEKTAEVIRQALALNQGKQLSRLTILYLGDKAYAEDVRASVEFAGARFLFRQFPVKKEAPDEAPMAMSCDH